MGRGGQSNRRGLFRDSGVLTSTGNVTSGRRVAEWEREWERDFGRTMFHVMMIVVLMIERGVTTVKFGREETVVGIVQNCVRKMRAKAGGRPV